MTATAPTCPACEAEMRLASDLASAGLARSWVCTDATCPTVVPEDEARSRRDDYLGAPLTDLMRAPVTPSGGGSSSSGGRRTEKPGEREHRLRIRRQIGDAEPIGRPDPEGTELGCDRMTSRVETIRLSIHDARRVDALAQEFGTRAAVWRQALDALEALHFGRLASMREEVVDDAQAQP